MPRELHTKLIYYDFFTLSTGGAASFVVTSFRANSCRDPVAAAGGGSPSGFTQLGYLYQHIRVNAVSVKVWGYNTCTSPITIGIIWRSSHGSAVASGVEAQQILMEMPALVGAVTTLIPYVNGNSIPEYSLRCRSTIAAIEGGGRTLDADYSSSFGAEPTTQCYADLVLCSSDGAAVSSTANAHVQITYDVVVSEPNQTYTD